MSRFYAVLYNNQINARALIGQSAMGYCASKHSMKRQLYCGVKVA